MGMRISSGAGTGGAGAAAWQQRQQNFQAMTQALQSNDLAAAKTAYTAMAGTSRVAASSNSPLALLGKALQANDLTGAQQAMSTVRSHHRAAPAAPISTSPAADGTALHLVA